MSDFYNEALEFAKKHVAPYAKEKCVHVRVAMKGLREDIENIEKEIDRIVEEIREIYPNAVII